MKKGLCAFVLAFVTTLILTSFVIAEPYNEVLINPKEGDCLKYNITLFDPYPTPYYEGFFNFTFLESYKYDVNNESFTIFNVTYSASEDMPLDPEIPHEGLVCVCINNRTVVDSTFGQPGGYFDLVIQKNVSIGETVKWSLLDNEVNAQIIGEENKTIDGIQYECWHLTATWGVYADDCLFHKDSGAMVHWYQKLEGEILNEWKLVEGMFGGVIIPEFPAFLILPLFMAATLLAVIIIRRKHRANLRVPV